MTKIKISAGICGFSTKITSTDKGGYKAQHSIESDCPNWNKFDQLFKDKEFNVMTELFKDKKTGTLRSEVIETALTTIPHVSCPVISGTLKALEVSVGLALPQDASITFID